MNEGIITLVWRFVRGVVATSLAQTVLLNVDWTNPEVATRTLVVGLISGFLLALSKAVRATDTGEKNVLIKNLPL